MVTNTDHSSLPSLAGMELKVKQDNCRNELGKNCLCVRVQSVRTNSTTFH